MYSDCRRGVSDVVVVVGASLIASTSVGFIPVLLITSIGSALGFILMYYIGFFLSEKVLRTGRIKFIEKSSLEKTDAWFSKYGYWIILANRFLPGTRSVISFFSGVHELVGNALVMEGEPERVNNLRGEPLFGKEESTDV